MNINPTFFYPHVFWLRCVSIAEHRHNYLKFYRHYCFAMEFGFNKRQSSRRIVQYEKLNDCLRFRSSRAKKNIKADQARINDIQNKAALEETTKRLNESCGCRRTLKISWKSYEKNARSIYRSWTCPVYEKKSIGELWESEAVQKSKKKAAGRQTALVTAQQQAAAKTVRQLKWIEAWRRKVELAKAFYHDLQSQNPVWNPVCPGALE